MRNLLGSLERAAARALRHNRGSGRWPASGRGPVPDGRDGQRGCFPDSKADDGCLPGSPAHDEGCFPQSPARELPPTA